ncbi:MAG: response regulator, partial [Spirochaetales bacterium]|nr:response regulator [Spirochaetales bacterium]
MNHAEGDVRSILIVDDHKIERETIEFLIHKHFPHLKTTLASNGYDALEIIKSIHVDILFADIKMPRMNGLELIRRGLMVNPVLKIIVFSGFGEFEYAKMAISLG